MIAEYTTLIQRNALRRGTTFSRNLTLDSWKLRLHADRRLHHHWHAHAVGQDVYEPPQLASDLRHQGLQL